jgi:hypothetical protein
MIQSDWYNTHVSEDVWASKLPSVNIHRIMAQFEPNVLVMDCEGYEAELLNAVDLMYLDMIAVEIHPKKCDPELLAKGCDRLENEHFEMIEEREAHPEPGLVYRIYRRRAWYLGDE